MHMKKNTRSSRSHIRFNALAMLIALAGFGWSSANAGEDATCKLVFDAMAKAMLTPNHQYISLKMQALNGGKPADSEIINTGKATYIQHDGKWKPAVSAQAMLDQMSENRKDAKSTCHFVRDEAIDGVSASLYAVHEAEGPDSKIWLAKTNGLPVHITMDTEGMHSDARYIYGAVSAPALN
jgi:hypothetical protein